MYLISDHCHSMNPSFIESCCGFVGGGETYFVGFSLVLEALILVYKFLKFIELFGLPFFLLFLSPIMNVVSDTSTL